MNHTSSFARGGAAAFALGAAALLGMGMAPRGADHATVSAAVLPQAAVTPLAPSDAQAGDGGAIAVGGDAQGSTTDSTSHTVARNAGSGNTAVNAAGNGQAHQVAEQPRTDVSHHISSVNRTRTDSHDSVNSHNSSSFHDSHNTDVHQP